MNIGALGIISVLNTVTTGANHRAMFGHGSHATATRANSTFRTVVCTNVPPYEEPVDHASARRWIGFVGILVFLLLAAAL